MTDTTNRQVRLTSRPVGVPQAHHFEIHNAAIETPTEAQVVVQNVYLSVEPAMRGWVNAVGNYSEPVGIGEVMRSFTSGVVTQSNSPDYQAGDWVTGMLGWQEFATVDADQIDRKIDQDGVPLSASLGILGMNGLTAYFGLLDCGQPKAGETVIVSTAAGAVGSAVGQIAKIHGCHVVGIAGGPDKTRQCLEQFGYDACIDYKTGGDLQAQLHAACPNGVDVYFDNTAGIISDSVMTCLNERARVIVCGTASVASWDPIPHGPRVERHLLVKRARMQGILIFDYADRFDEGRIALSQWIRSNQLTYAEDILEGIEQAPDAIAGLYRGENKGKRLVRLIDQPA